MLVATPVLTGSLIRLPLGMWTDRFGGRIVFFILMLSTRVADLADRATRPQYWHFLVLGLFVGVAGGSFSVGIAYCARWFPKDRQGFAMGIFGAGNSGAAVTKFVAPTHRGGLRLGDGAAGLCACSCWCTAMLFWFFSYHRSEHTRWRAARHGAASSLRR